MRNGGTVGGAALVALLAVVGIARAVGGTGAATADRLVLKSGRELVGRIESDADHAIRFVDARRGALTLDRRQVRTLVRGDDEPGLFAPLVLEPPVDEAPKSYMRWEPPSAAGPGHLSTGIARFFDERTRTTLFLVGAVHIADLAYYARIQDLLDSCDVVLFEGVGARPGRPAPSEAEVARMDALTQMQMMLKDALGLAFQHDGLDYRRPFWRNADVDFTTLSERMQAEGVALPSDSPLMQALLKLAVGSLDLGKAGSDPAIRALLKRQTAPALAMSDQLLAGVMGKLGSVLVDWRNDAALAVLDDELAHGRSGRWIALFYGAAHLPDMARKVVARGFAYQRSGWAAAWEVE